LNFIQRANFSASGSAEKASKDNESSMFARFCGLEKNLDFAALFSSFFPLVRANQIVSFKFYYNLWHELLSPSKIATMASASNSVSKKRKWKQPTNMSNIRTKVKNAKKSTCQQNRPGGFCTHNFSKNTIIDHYVCTKPMFLPAKQLLVTLHFIDLVNNFPKT